MTKYPILILHGWNLSSVSYKPLITELTKKKYQVFVPDFPGFGTNKSLKRPYSMNDYVTFISNYLETNKIKKTVLIGHSFGGRVAILFGVKYPDKIKSLILTGVPGFMPVSPIKVRVFFVLSKIGKTLLLVPGMCFFEKFIRRIFHKLAGANDYSHTDGVMRDTFKSIIAHDLVLPMRKLLAPVLLIWGEKDGVVSVSIAKKMQKTIPHCHLEIVPNATHRVPYSYPQLFTKKVVTFLNRFD